MRLTSSSNPAMSDKIFNKQATSSVVGETMTINGTITRIGMMMVLVIQIISIAQAMDISDNIDNFSSSAKKLHEFVRVDVPELIEDVSLNKNMEALKSRLQENFINK